MTFETAEYSIEICWALMEDDEKYWEPQQANSAVSDGSDVEEYGANDDRLRKDDRDDD